MSNLTSSGNQTTILTFVSEINNIMGHLPAILILVAVGILLFMILHQQGVDPFRNAATSTFITMILAMVMYPMGLILGNHLIVFALLFPGTMAILWIFGGSQYP